MNALPASLPRTTAAMLELDYLHRVKSPLDPKLRAMMRWTAARANHCAYSESRRARAAAVIKAAARRREAFSLAEPLSIFGGSDESLNHLSSDEVAVELIQLR